MHLSQYSSSLKSEFPGCSNFSFTTSIAHIMWINNRKTNNLNYHEKWSTKCQSFKSILQWKTLGVVWKFDKLLISEIWVGKSKLNPKNRQRGNATDDSIGEYGISFPSGNWQIQLYYLKPHWANWYSGIWEQEGSMWASDTNQEKTKPPGGLHD